MSAIIVKIISVHNILSSFDGMVEPAIIAKNMLAGTHGISSIEYGKLKDKTAVDTFLSVHKIDPKKAIVTVEPHAKNVSIERAKEADALPEYLEAKKYVDILIKKLGSKTAVCFSIVMGLSGHYIVQFFIR
jgi:hypothetical protein